MNRMQKGEGEGCSLLDEAVRATHDRARPEAARALLQQCETGQARIHLPSRTLPAEKDAATMNRHAARQQSTLGPPAGRTTREATGAS